MQSGGKVSFSKIFRPWDGADRREQDATVSTTQEDHEDDTEKSPQEPRCESKQRVENLAEKSTKDQAEKTSGTRTKCPRLSQDESTLCSNAASLSGPTQVDWYNESLLLEAAVLAHGLGHGHAAEEYARVLLGEEQRARLHAAARKQRPKKHKCPHCDVGFSNNGQLKGHIRIHTGERPFRCDAASCGKTFTRNEELTRHKRIHSGLRPFACAECGKRFGRKDHLKKHTRTHAQHRAAAAMAAVYAAATATAVPLPLPMSVPVSLPIMPPAATFDPWPTANPYVHTTLYGY